MPYPPLVSYDSIEGYRDHFERVYCRGPVVTFDGISVRFQKRDFYHAFFESKRIKDDTFSLKRAQRIDWIKTTLLDPTSERYVGWDSNKKKYDHHRRVAVVKGNYVVVIAVTVNGQGRFITAYVADSGRTIRMIRQGPKWA